MTPLALTYTTDQWIAVINSACGIASKLPRGRMPTLSQILMYAGRSTRFDAVIEPSANEFDSSLRVFVLKEGKILQEAKRLKLQYLLLTEKGKLVFLTVIYKRYVSGMESIELPMDVVDDLKFPVVPRRRFSEKYPSLPSLEGKETVEEAIYICIRDCDADMLRTMITTPFEGFVVLSAIVNYARELRQANPHDQLIQNVHEELEKILAPLFDPIAWAEYHKLVWLAFYGRYGYRVPYKDVARAKY